MALTPAAWYARDTSTIGAAVFTASQSTTTLTVSAVTSGTLGVGTVVWSSGSTYLGVISALGTGTGGTGTYTMTNSATVASTTMVGFTGITTGSGGWSSVAAWAPSTSYTVGQLVRQKNMASVFTASTSGSSTTLTISAITSGGVAPNQSLFWAGSSTTPITISSLGTSTGGTGTVTMSSAQTIGSQLMVSMLTPGNERVFVCVAAGTSGSTEPAWVLTRNSATTDGTVTWREVTGQPVLNGDTTNGGVWTAVSAATSGGNSTTPALCANTARTHVFICTAGGSSNTGASEPTWNTTTGGTTTDGTLTWTCLGPGGNFGAWAAPAARLSNVLNTTWAQAGNSVFLGNDHAEVQPAAITITNINGTPASPINVLSVNPATVPPTGSTLLAGASVTTVGPSTFAIDSSSLGMSFFGVTLSCGTGPTASALTLYGARMVLDTCTLCKLGTNGTASAILLGQTVNSDLSIINCGFRLGSTSDRIQLSGRGRQQSISSILASGSVTPTALFSSQPGWTWDFAGVDLSGLGSSTIFNTPQAGISTLSGCKLSSAAVLMASPSSGAIVDALCCDSAGTQYQRARYAYAGTLTTETTVVRTGGASIEGTSVSDKIVTTSNCSFAAPFASIPLLIRNAVTGSNVTVTVYGLAPAGLPTNDQVWLEVEYPGASGSPLSSIVTTAKANVLATGASVTSDSSTWGGAGTAFKLVAVLTSPTPQLAGFILARVKCGKPSATFYIDPLAVLS